MRSCICSLQHHCLIMLYISSKFYENISKGFRVIEQTQNHDRQTDGRMDGGMYKIVTLGPLQTSSCRALITDCFKDSLSNFASTLCVKKNIETCYGDFNKE